MIKKIIKKGSINDDFIKNADMEHWATKSPQERVETVEILRRQFSGSTKRLQRIVRVVQLKQS